MAAGAGVSAAWGAAKQTGALCYARTKYFDDLEADIRVLNSEKSLLEQMQEEVKSNVRQQLDQNPHMQQQHMVTCWLERVNRLTEDVDRILPEAEEELEHKNRRFFFPKKFCYFDRVGNRVKKNLQEVVERIKEGNFEQLVETKPRELVVEMPMGNTVVQISKFDDVRGYMEDTRTRVIGLWGTGGVGKTTLLKMINNSIYKARKERNRRKSKNDLCSFDLVIWVNVSKEGGVGNIQEAIFKKLGIPEEDWKSASVSLRADKICNLLRSYKLALLLDDVWEQKDYNDRLDLLSVKVPPDFNNNGSKVVFTTRHESTCRIMRANQTIEVGCLPLNEGLEFFRRLVDEAEWDDNDESRRLEKQVVEACEGLPLALVMSAKIGNQKWKDVIGIPNQVENGVFHVSKVSYGNLNDYILRTCFLYFSVFLEVHNLNKEELIELWIAEGFLTDHNGTNYSWKEGERLLAKKKENGEAIIQRLENARLLDSGKSKNSITMHDITLEMTLWLAREEGKEENKVVVQEGKIDFAKWNDAERLSLWGPGISSVNQTPSCHRLTTLMVRATKLRLFPSKLFPAMPGLRVLNLSDNEDLAEVPEDIGQLKNLPYLNLSGTSIKVLPLEYQYLTCLEVLLLDNTRCLETIPSEVIRGLLSLQVFSRTLDWQQRLVSAEEGILDGLENLEHVYEIRITLYSTDSIQRLKNSPKLRKCIKLLFLMLRTDGTTLKLSLAGMEHLKRLELQDCESVTEIQFVEEERQVGISINIARSFVGQESFTNLTHVDVSNCPVQNMSWLTYAPKLQNLGLARCWEMVAVVGDAVEGLFSNLTHLTLEGLPKLERISNGTLLFPCLLELYVSDCPNLLELPFDSSSAKKLEEIRGDKTWWEKVKCPKGAFSKKFRPIWRYYPPYYGSSEPYRTPYYTTVFSDENPSACCVT